MCRINNPWRRYVTNNKVYTNDVSLIQEIFIISCINPNSCRKFDVKINKILFYLLQNELRLTKKLVYSESILTGLGDKYMRKSLLWISEHVEIFFNFFLLSLRTLNILHLQCNRISVITFIISDSPKPVKLFASLMPPYQFIKNL